MVKFCGHKGCRRQYDESEKRCRNCGSILVEWDYDGGEPEQEAVWRWRKANGKMFDTSED